MELFRQLGDEIESLWVDQNYDEERFPAIASDALKRADLPSKLSAWDVVEWTLKQYELPRQRDIGARFADPPITIFSGLRFHIDLYFWFEGTTAIHQHSFCGAFQVLLGSSIHSWYEFETTDAVNTFCEFGDLNLKVCELLKVGDTQEIWAGKGYVHSLFHLDQPSATIVVRTDRSPLHLPQFAYYKPNFAIDPFFEQDTWQKKQQVLGTLFRAKRDNAVDVTKELLRSADLQTSFGLLTTARHYLKAGPLGQAFNVAGVNERLAELLDVVIARHGSRGEAMRPVFERLALQDDLISKRSVVADPEPRFFFALLLNVDGRERILRLIKERFPDGDPVEKVLDWCFDLSRTRIFGAGGNALGLPELGDTDLEVLEAILRGKSVEEARTINSDAAERIASSTIFAPLLR